MPIVVHRLLWFYLVPDECETATDNSSTPRRRYGIPVRADARCLPLPLPAAAAADAVLLQVESLLRPRRSSDSGGAGGAQAKASAAVTQAQRRRRGQCLRRPRRNPYKVLPSTVSLLALDSYPSPRSLPQLYIYTDVRLQMDAQTRCLQW
jgi:hypothetical protein